MRTTPTDAVSLPDAQLLRRFDIPGPRYTSYPTADRFVETFDAPAFAGRLGKRKSFSGAAPLSLYVHLPFCNTVCYYCACNKVVTRDRTKTTAYLDALEREAALVGGLLAGTRTVAQLHWGGGTPTFLDDEELRRLMRSLTQHFARAPDGEFSIEVDPRSTPPGKVQRLAELGFNRLSVGVQDFDPQVQQAVNREQSFEMTRATIDAARRASFKSVNLDLIYGLPRQSRASFAATLDRVLALSPERIALYRYAHLPDRFKPQRRIQETELLLPAENLAIMADAIARMTAAGYVYIGMDHFARADDELARAQVQGRLHRNFQGYSTHADCDLIGLGVSAISKVGPTYAQNARDLPAYYDRVNQGRLATVRGVQLDRDDQVRRAAIMALMCHFEVSKEEIAAAHRIDFDAYFQRELEALVPFLEAGLAENSADRLTVTPRGKLLVRAIAMNFDRYLNRDPCARRYSRIL